MGFGLGGTVQQFHQFLNVLLVQRSPQLILLTWLVRRRDIPSRRYRRGRRRVRYIVRACGVFRARQICESLRRNL